MATKSNYDINSLQSLQDVVSGAKMLPTECYTNPDYYEFETKRIFEESWKWEKKQVFLYTLKPIASP